MKEIHLLPTEKPSRLFKFANELHLDTIPKDYYKKYQIYITSDEEIKPNEWYLFDGNVKLLFLSDKEFNEGNNPNNSNPRVTDFNKKIILTTDQDLIADGVQAIDDEFLEWFVKNSNCESVEVKQELGVCLNCEWNYDSCPNTKECLKGKYKIIIPQEKPKQDSTLENAKLALREHILANKEKVAEDLQEMREKSGTGRDETLEEVAEKYSELQAGTFTPPHKTTYKHGFEDGAKWMQEQMEKLKDFDTWKEWKNK
jgi:hypothetical protein